MADNELGGYLRSRREAVTPGHVGLPAGARRRTPGLRRAELATLAGVSVEYLTRIEQGRDRHPSAQVLGALADALQLSAAERDLLLRAAKASGGDFPCVATGPPARAVRPTVLALLDRLEPAPAFVANRVGDLLVHTTGYERLAGPIGVLDPHHPNLVRYLFIDPRARSAYPDWERVADEQVAALKLESRRDDPHVAELVDELTVTAGAPFARRYQAVLVPPERVGVQRLVHPQVGALRLAFETLDLPDAGDQRLVVYLPADDATSAALDHLAGRHPGALRAVPNPPARSA